MSNHPTCEYVSNYLAPTNIQTKNKDYYEVERIINNYLRVRPSIHHTYDDNFNSWVCTQIYDGDEDYGNERMDCISIFLDNKTREHVVEVRRLKGNCLNECLRTVGFHPIYNNLIDLFAESEHHTHT